MLTIFLAAAASIAGPAWAGSDDICEQSEGDTIQLEGTFLFLPIDDGPPETATDESSGAPIAGANWTVRIHWMERGKDDLRVGGVCSVRTDKNGHWTKRLKRPVGADSLMIAVYSENQYVSVTSRPGTAYEVANKDDIPVPKTDQPIDTGRLIADLSNSGVASENNLIGVGDVMAAADHFWERTWEESLDVQSRNQNGYDKAIRIYYPNSWYPCSAAASSNMTCASSDERAEIWIAGGDIANAQLTRRERHITVMHELAHQLNADKWHFRRPADRPQVATMRSCDEQSEADALTEGFATAIAAWAYYGETYAEPKVYWLDTDGKLDETNLEAPDRAKHCGQGERDHTWVSALFWDLLDHRVEDPSSRHLDDDSWSYRDPLAAFKTYLAPPSGNGGLSVWGSILDLREAFKRNLSQADKDRIDEIYRNNNMTSP